MFNCDLSRVLSLGHGSYLGIVGLVLALLVGSYLLIRLLRYFNPKNGSGADRDDSLNIAKMRYANGEISDEEFARIKETLGDQ